MRERVSVTVICTYIICFFSFLLIIIGGKQENAVYVSNPVNEGLVIIIDAGHGGSDGGSVGADGTYESLINLSIARKLNDILSVTGFKTYMTRTDENSLGEKGVSIRHEKITDIHRRMDIMNSFDNCLFVSVHQNYYQGSSSWGTQVFYSANNSQSELIAERIQSSVVSLLQNENNRKIKKSGSSIYLLDKAKKPAVLVECGFISNSDDLKSLNDDKYQKSFAFCVENGIIDYLDEKGALYGFKD